jgi:hypothetical protein
MCHDAVLLVEVVIDAVKLGHLHLYLHQGVRLLWLI